VRTQNHSSRIPVNVAIAQNVRFVCSRLTFVALFAAADFAAAVDFALMRSTNRSWEFLRCSEWSSFEPPQLTRTGLHLYRNLFISD